LRRGLDRLIALRQNVGVGLKIAAVAFVVGNLAVITLGGESSREWFSLLFWGLVLTVFLIRQVMELDRFHECMTAARDLGLGQAAAWVYRSKAILVTGMLALVMVAGGAGFLATERQRVPVTEKVVGADGQPFEKVIAWREEPLRLTAFRWPLLAGVVLCLVGIVGTSIAQLGFVAEVARGCGAADLAAQAGLVARRSGRFALVISLILGGWLGALYLVNHLPGVEPPDAVNGILLLLGPLGLIPAVVWAEKRGFIPSGPQAPTPAWPHLLRALRDTLPKAAAGHLA
jgi:hypothetical protein